MRGNSNTARAKPALALPLLFMTRHLRGRVSLGKAGNFEQVLFARQVPKSRLKQSRFDSAT
jgi:hypothetical protein